MPKHHQCLALGCDSDCPPAHLMCIRHWRMVPAELQLQVYQTFRKRSRGVIDKTWAPWWRASQRAVHAVALQERPDWAGAQAYLNRELAFAEQLESAEKVAGGPEA